MNKKELLLRKRIYTTLLHHIFFDNFYLRKNAALTEQSLKMSILRLRKILKSNSYTHLELTDIEVATFFNRNKRKKTAILRQKIEEIRYSIQYLKKYHPRGRPKIPFKTAAIILGAIELASQNPKLTSSLKDLFLNGGVISQEINSIFEKKLGIAINLPLLNSLDSLGDLKERINRSIKGNRRIPSKKWTEFIEICKTMAMTKTTENRFHDFCEIGNCYYRPLEFETFLALYSINTEDISPSSLEYLENTFDYESFKVIIKNINSLN